VKTRSTVLSFAALATLSLMGLAPTQASAHDGYGFGSYRSMGSFGPSFRAGFRAPELCPTEYAPLFQRHHAPGFNYTEEAPLEEEAFQRRGYERGYVPEGLPPGYAPMQQTQGYGPLQQTQGYAPPPNFRVPEPHGRRDFGQINRQDSNEQTLKGEAQAPPQQANPAGGPQEYSSKELQR
jgi:hypothetical protein